MAYWLIKSEPSAYSWEQMVRDGRTGWSGVRNHQAAGNMRAMDIGDECFFYHSNEGKEIVGTVRVTKTYHPDPTDAAGKFGMVEVAAGRPFRHPVGLAFIKSHKQLKNMAFVRQSRLSVSPVSAEEWETVCELGAG